MILDDELVIQIDDAKFYFAEVTQQEYLALVESKDKRMEAEHIFSRLTRVEGLFRKNGDAIQVEAGQKLQLPMSLCIRLTGEYWKAVTSKLGLTSGAEAGKAQS